MPSDILIFRCAKPGGIVFNLQMRELSRAGEATLLRLKPGDDSGDALSASARPNLTSEPGR